MATFTNQAILTYNNTQVVSNLAQGEVLDALTLTKNVTGSDYSQGDSLTYILSLVNTGTFPLTGLTVTDDLGGYTLRGNTVYPLTYESGSVRYFVDGLPQQTPPVVQSASPLTFTGITVPGSGNSMLVYRVNVNEYAPLGPEAVLTNSATVSGAGITAVTADASVSASSDPVLSINKTISPVPATENSRITYTFLIQNSGATPADAGDDVTLRDVFDPLLNSLTVTLDGVPLTEDVDYTYTSAGQFTTVPGRITVPAAAYLQNPQTGAITVRPGSTVLVVTGVL